MLVDDAAARQVTRPQEVLPDHARGVFSAQVGHGQGGRRRLASSIRRARRSGWWANRAAARRRPAGSILRLDRADRGRRSIFEGQRRRRRSPQGRCAALRREMQIIFQDPYASLNPRMTVGDDRRRAADRSTSSRRTASEREQRVVASCWSTVGLRPSHVDRYPHEFSGGQRQRIGIARALAVQPEASSSPTSRSRRSTCRSRRRSSTCCRTCRTSSASRTSSSRTTCSVVRAHQRPRRGDVPRARSSRSRRPRSCYANPLHPYTRGAAVGGADPRSDQKRKRIMLEGDVPSPINPPSGCRFHTRCSLRVPSCSENEQVLKEITPGHWVACQVRTGVAAR